MPEVSHDTLAFLQFVTAILTSLIASSGFWLFLEKRRGNRALERKLMMGLAHDRIITLSVEFIKKGWVSHDEYENLYNFLYLPYKEMGGNGSGERLMQEVANLPLINQPIHSSSKGEDDDFKQPSL